MKTAPESIRRRQRPRVRRFEPTDRDDFLDLYEAVWGRAISREWFAWRYEETPYADDVHVLVADDGERLVGAEPCLVLPVRAGGETATAHQPADWMVHPDARRQGIFTRMTEHLLEGAPWDPPRLYFNFPSAAILPGLRRFDWRVAGTLPSYYRLHRPTACLANGASGAFGRAKAALDRLSGLAARAYFRVRDARLPDPGVAVTRHETPPVGVLADLYRSSVPDRLHVVRDERFYRWRLANPLWESAVYVARRDGRPVAALVAREEDVDGLRMTSLLDALPLGAGVDDGAGAGGRGGPGAGGAGGAAADRDGGPGPDEARAALVRAAVADGAGADLLRARGSIVPPGTLRAFGFQSDDAFPLSALSSPTTMMVRPGRLDADGAWRLGGRQLGAIDDWRLSLADQDFD